MKLQTVKSPDKFIQRKLDAGWVIVDERRSNDPIFYEDDSHEVVGIVEYHFHNENGGYAGVLTVATGNGWTQAEFMPFTVTL